MENGDSNSYSGILALFIMGSPLILLYVCLAIKTWLEKDTEGKAANEYTRYKFIPPHKDKYTKHIIEHKYEKSLKQRPPNASFFGRLDGKEVNIEGPYEEKFLNGVETARWKLKQKHKELESMED